MDGEMRSYSLIALLILLGCPLVMTPTAEAQKTRKCRLTVGDDGRVPNWLSFDLELRSRTEGQPAINFLPGVSPVYDLSRLRIGVGVKAPNIFSLSANAGCHALALPVRFVASNMRTL